MTDKFQVLTDKDKLQILADEINIQYVRAEDMARITDSPEWHKVAEILYDLQSVSFDLMNFDTKKGEEV